MEVGRQGSKYLAGAPGRDKHSFVLQIQHVPPLRCPSQLAWVAPRLHRHPQRRNALSRSDTQRTRTDAGHSLVPSMCLCSADLALDTGTRRRAQNVPLQAQFPRSRPAQGARPRTEARRHLGGSLEDRRDGLACWQGLLIPVCLCPLGHRVATCALRPSTQKLQSTMRVHVDISS